MGDLLVEANPYSALILKQKEALADMDECNRVRLMNDVDLLYFQKDVKQKMGISMKSRLKTATKMDKQLEELKSQLKEEFKARK